LKHKGHEDHEETTKTSHLKTGGAEPERCSTSWDDEALGTTLKGKLEACPYNAEVTIVGAAILAALQARSGTESVTTPVRSRKAASSPTRSL